MSKLIQDYIKIIAREKRKDLLTIGLVASFFLLFLAFGVMLALIQQNLLSSRTAIDLNDGSVKSISRIDAIKAREFEAYHHCRYFMENFFEFDKSNYKTRLNRALWIGDNSVKTVYTELLKNGWYNSVIDANIRQYVAYGDNDITINFDSKPYKVSINFKIFLRSELYKEEEHFGSVSFVLADCSRDKDYNPHGFEIRSFEITNFK
jgi:hypothetical protein